VRRAAGKGEAAYKSDGSAYPRIMAGDENSGVAGGLIPRPALLRKLNEARIRRLTLIQAPAGYGKTALLHQWCASAALDGSGVTRLSFAEERWTWARWARVVTRELARSGCAGSAGADASACLDDGTAAEALRSQLQNLRAPHLIVFDGYENCDTPEIGALVNQLLPDIPTGVHLAIASRRRPAVYFAKLYATGVATLIGAADLQFSHEETLQLLQPLLPPERIGELHQLSEGWPVILRLARLWLESGGDPTSVIAAASDPREETAMFLAEQVIRTLSSEESAFLTDTSVLEGVTPDLADYVLADEISVKHLHSLHSLYPLVRPAAAGSSTIYVHPVLRAYLRHLLAEKGASHVQLLNRRAAQWYANNRDMLSAVRHAVKSDQPNLGAQLFASDGGISLMASGHSTLEQILAELSPGQELGEHEPPRLMLAKLVRESLSPDALESQKRLEQLKAAIAAFGDDPTLRPEAMIAEAWFQALLDEAPSRALLNELGTAVSDEAHIDLGIRVLAAAYLEMCSLQRGDPAKVLLDDQALSSLCREHDFPYQRCYSLIYRGICAHLVGDYPRAASLADEAADVAGTLLGPNRYQPLLSARTLKAEILFDIGALQDANLLVRSAVELLEGQVTCYDVYAPLLRVTFGLTLMGSGTSEALAALHTLAKKARPVASARLHNLLLAHESSALALLNPAECDIAAIESAWKRLREVPEQVTWREIDAVGLAYARALVVTAQYTAAESVLEQLNDLAAPSKWRRTLVEIRLLRAWISLERCEAEAAVRALNEAIELAQPYGLRSPFLNAAEIVAHVSSIALSRGTPSESIKFAKEIVRMRKDISGPYRLPFLTPAEHSVLLELVQGAANKVIARRLNVTENTIKTHLKSIFKKASLQSREEAIGFARKYLM
jgi:LuxR family transcriptional regulator, maltose regulon positive regulatory protein